MLPCPPDNPLSGIHERPFRSKPIAWCGQPVSLVSLGCGDKAVLTPTAVDAISNAQIIIGAAHHQAEISDYIRDAEFMLFPSPFSELSRILSTWQDKRIVVTASGDGLFFGVGNWLGRLIGRKHLTCFANVSSIQYAFHGLGLPWHHADIVSLHGRQFNTLRRHLENGKWLGIFTDSEQAPGKIASELVYQGFSSSSIWVCENLGSPKQTIRKFEAQALAQDQYAFDPLHVCVVKVQGNASYLPGFPGIEDWKFITDGKSGHGMISKREVRLGILSLMQCHPGEIAWDIGAGCGSVSVEWARWNPLGTIHAIEQNAKRASLIRQNSDRFGTGQNLLVHVGKAPDCCRRLPDPGCIFIGGSGDLGEMLEFAWHTLTAGGKLVASAVTAKSQAALQAFLADKPDREWISLSVSKTGKDTTPVRDYATVHLGKCVKR